MNNNTTVECPNCHRHHPADETGLKPKPHRVLRLNKPTGCSYPRVTPAISQKPVTSSTHPVKPDTSLVGHLVTLTMPGLLNNQLGRCVAQNTTHVAVAFNYSERPDIYEWINTKFVVTGKHT